MDFLADQEIEVLRAWVRGTPTALLISGADGVVFWCNGAFERWSGYTRGELVALGWERLSAEDADLDADREAARECIAGVRTKYAVQKRYIPKNGRPAVGTLGVMRYPESGAFQFFLCAWYPAENGTAKAFRLAMDNMETVADALERVRVELVADREELAKLSRLTNTDRWVLSSWAIAGRNPKLTWSIVFALLGLMGVGNAVELFQRFVRISGGG